MSRLLLAFCLAIPEPAFSIAMTVIAVGGLLATAGALWVERKCDLPRRSA